MQGNGCHYGTAFPISVVAWILKREAKLRPNGKITRFIDACAGWGDRVAGALIVGNTIVENYVGIDPWDISNQSCKNIYKLLSNKNRCNAIFLQKGAEDETESWPDADLVLMCPPYAELECYNIDSNDPNDHQAWRLCTKGKFMSGFIIPMLRNAAKSTKKTNGRMIINIANTGKGGGENLTEETKEAAKSMGLELVETFGMRLSVRATPSTYDHGAPVYRGEPFFVFEHSKSNCNSNSNSKNKII